ncbi:MAG: hypothetical protein ABF246_09635, partial [Winogradskyella sp.]
YLKKQNRELTLDEFIYKDKKTVETIKGDFNNDSLEDVIIITDISGDTFTIEIKLFNDMSNIGNVYILEDLDRQEIETLENQSNE